MEVLMTSVYNWFNSFIELLKAIGENKKVLLTIIALLVGTNGYSVFNNLEKNKVLTETKSILESVVRSNPVTEDKVLVPIVKKVYITKPVETKVIEKTAETIVVVDEKYKDKIRKHIKKFEKHLHDFH